MTNRGPVLSFALFEARLNESQSVKLDYSFRNFDSVDASRAILDAILDSFTLTRQQRRGINMLRESNMPFWAWDSLNEGLWDTVKDVASKGVDKAKEIAATTKGKADEIGKFLKTLGGDIKGLVDQIKNFVINAITKLYDKGKEVVEKLMKSEEEKVKEHVEKEKEKDEAKIKTEAVGLKDLGVGSVKYLKGKFVTDLEKGIDSADREDVEAEEIELAPTKESLSAEVPKAIMLSVADLIREQGDAIIPLLRRSRIIRESAEDHGHDGSNNHHFEIKFFDKIAHFLDKYPPFKQLSELAEVIGENINKALDKASEFFAKVGALAKSVVFDFIGKMIGLFAESKIKGIMAQGITSTIGLVIPGLNAVVGFLATTAFGIWICHIVHQVVGALGIEDWFEEMGYEAKAEGAH